MGRQFNKPEVSDDYVLPPEGTSAAVCSVLAYLGRHESTWNGEIRMRDLVGIQYELSEPADDGRALAVNEVLTASLHPKSKFYARVVALAGGREPQPGADLERLLGRGAIVTVAHGVKGDRTYADVVQVGPLPRGMAAPVPSVSALYYDIEAPDHLAFERLPARFKKLVETAGQTHPQAAPPRPAAHPPGHQAGHQAKRPPAAQRPPEPPPFDDDIPF